MIETSKTFPHILLHNAQKYGHNKVAIREKDYGIWQSYSWQDYLDQVKDFALGLASLGFKRGDKMAIITLDDRTARLEARVYSDVYEHYRDVLGQDKLLVVEGEVSADEVAGMV